MSLSLYRIFLLALPFGNEPPGNHLYLVVGYCAKFVLFLAFQSLTARYMILAQLVLENRDDSIIINSGASMSICPDRSRLLNYRPYYFPLPLGGVGGIAYGIGRGDMEVDTIVKDGDNSTRRETLYIRGVVHVPGTDFTVISTEKLRSQGIFYSSETAVLYRKHGICDVVVAETVIGGNVPLLRCPKPELTVPFRSSFQRFWSDLRHQSFVSPWSWWSRYTSSAGTRTTLGRIAARISELEKDNTELLYAADFLREKNLKLESLLSRQLQSNPAKGAGASDPQRTSSVTEGV